jgi:hypothetical protein
MAALEASTNAEFGKIGHLPHVSDHEKWMELDGQLDVHNRKWPSRSPSVHIAVDATHWQTRGVLSSVKTAAGGFNLTLPCLIEAK